MFSLRESRSSPLHSLTRRARMIEHPAVHRDRITALSSSISFGLSFALIAFPCALFCQSFLQQGQLYALSLLWYNGYIPRL